MRAASLSELEVDRQARRLAVEAVVSDPLRFLLLAPRKIFHLYAEDAQALRWNLKGLHTGSASSNYSDWKIGLMGLIQLHYTIILAGVAVFIADFLYRKRICLEVSSLGLGLLLYFTFVAIVFFGSPRFHFPLVPFLCLYSTCTAVFLAQLEWGCYEAF